MKKTLRDLTKEEDYLASEQGWLIKRKTCYIMQPYMYEIECDVCYGKNITWSEFEKRIWCYDCKIDTKGTEGIFSVPIPIEVTKLLGISLDKVVIETGEILELKKVNEEGKLDWIRTGRFIGDKHE